MELLDNILQHFKSEKKEAGTSSRSTKYIPRPMGIAGVIALGDQTSCRKSKIKGNYMTIKEVKKELIAANHPVAKSLHYGSSFKVLIVGFNKGMILKEHKAPIQSKLTVLEGAVIYKEEFRVIKLMQYDEVEIPTEIAHAVEAVENSLCVLTQG